LPSINNKYQIRIKMPPSKKKLKPRAPGAKKTGAGEEKKVE
jgi:hypothetical protein